MFVWFKKIKIVLFYSQILLYILVYCGLCRLNVMNYQLINLFLPPKSHLYTCRATLFHLKNLLTAKIWIKLPKKKLIFFFYRLFRIWTIRLRRNYFNYFFILCSWTNVPYWLWSLTVKSSMIQPYSSLFFYNCCKTCSIICLSV